MNFNEGFANQCFANNSDPANNVIKNSLSTTTEFQKMVNLSNITRQDESADSYFTFNTSLQRIFRNNVLLPPRSMEFKNEVYTGPISDSNVNIPLEYLKLCVAVNNDISPDLQKIYNTIIPCIQINLYKLEMIRYMLKSLNCDHSDSSIVNFIIQLTSFRKSIESPLAFAQFCENLTAPPNWSFIEIMIKYLNLCVLLKSRYGSVMYNTNYINQSFFIFDYSASIVTLHYGKQMCFDFESSNYT